MWEMQYMYDNLLKIHSFCWALHTKWYPSVKIAKEIHVKHDLGNRIDGGQGQNKIEGPHLHHVGIAIHTWQFVEKAKRLLGTACKVVPIREDRHRKSKLNMTLETGYMKVKVKTKYIWLLLLRIGYDAGDFSVFWWIISRNPRKICDNLMKNRRKKKNFVLTHFMHHCFNNGHWVLCLPISIIPLLLKWWT